MRVNFTGLIISLLVLGSASLTLAFYDDFNDGDISDWEPRCAPGVWLPTSGMVYGSTSTTPSILAPIDVSLYDDCEVSVSAKGIHAFGVVIRLDDEDSTIMAYVSPDHNVARIWLIESGVPTTILTSLSAPYPSNVWYDLTFTCDGPDLTFEIYVPSTGFSRTLNATDPSPQAGKFGLLMGNEPGTYWDWILVSGAFGDTSISWMNTDDTAQGNGNMAFEAGEEIDLNLQLLNPGDELLEGVFAVLQSLSSDIQITQNYVNFGSIPAGGTAWGADGYGVYAIPGAPEDQLYDFILSVFGDGGYSASIDFSLPLGMGLSCDVETGTDDWSWGNVEEGWLDNWHVSSQRNHTAGGSQSFKCGDTGSGDYDNHLYSYLVTPLFNTPTQAGMGFWMWIDAQYLQDPVAASEAYDGGIIQYGRCGTWIDLVPLGGYPWEIIQGSSGPFADGTDVFSGLAGWTEWSVLIPDSLAGPGQIRFVFGSDNSGTREGWYLDDIDVWGYTGVEGSSSQSIDMPGLQVWPNPFRGSVTFTAAGVPEGPLSVEIYDLSGRLVASPEFGSAGIERSLLWDGRGSDNTEIPSGLYLMKLSCSNDSVLRIVKLE